MKIVCCCVTEDRPEFMPWLMWNYIKQTHEDKELLIIDTGETIHNRVALENLPGVKVVHREHGMKLPAKMNLALDLADGDAIAWMDDDDWQAPDRLERLAGALIEGRSMSGTLKAAWINLENRTLVRHTSPMVIFNSCLVRLDAARSARFDESILKTSDSHWMMDLLKRHRPVILPDMLHAWVCHGENICNPASSRDWSKAVDVQDVLGSATTYKLREISERLENRHGV